jgi:hypothetical protein
MEFSFIFNLMSLYRCPLSNGEQILINILKASSSIISMCNLHEILLSKITQIYFACLAKGTLRSFNIK